VREAYGLAMLEAQAAGLPVVAGREGGVPEVVQHDVTGILTPPRDPETFARAVEALLGEPDRLRKMAAAACRFVAGQRSSEQAADALGAALRDAQAIRAARA
jgi:glycosyltransferase involved in cell wall biosynthesis